MTLPSAVQHVAAQIALDLVTSVLSEWLVFGQSPRTTAEHVGRASLIDAALAPAGLALAIAGHAVCPRSRATTSAATRRWRSGSRPATTR